MILRYARIKVESSLVRILRIWRFAYFEELFKHRGYFRNRHNCHQMDLSYDIRFNPSVLRPGAALVWKRNLQTAIYNNLVYSSIERDHSQIDREIYFYRNSFS